MTYKPVKGHSIELTASERDILRTSTMIIRDIHSAMEKTNSELLYYQKEDGIDGYIDALDALSLANEIDGIRSEKIFINGY